MKKQLLSLILFALCFLNYQNTNAQCGFTIGIDQTVCTTVSSVTPQGDSLGVAITYIKWHTSGTGSFSPNDSVSNATYSPSGADKTGGIVMISANVTNGCGSHYDSSLVSFTNAPIVNAGPDQTACTGNTFSINGSVSGPSTGNLWTTTGTGSFSNTLSVTTIYTPSAADIVAGSVSLSLAATGMANCGTFTDVLNVTITPGPSADAGINQFVCGDSILLNGSVVNAGGGSWTTSGTGFFTNSSQLITVYNASVADHTAGSIMLTLATTGNGTCSPAYDTVTIVFSGSSSVNAGADLVVCGNEVSLSGTMIGAAKSAFWSTSGTGTFSPSPNFLFTTYLPSAADKAAGSVTLTLTSNADGSCSTGSDQLVVTLPPAVIPVANAGMDLIVSGKFTLNGSVSGVGGGKWTTTGSGTFSNDNSLTPTYTPSSGDHNNGTLIFKLTTTGNGACLSASDYVTVVIGNDFTISGHITGGGSDLDEGMVLVYKRKGFYYDFIKAEFVTASDNGNYTIDSLSVGKYIAFVIPTGTMVSTYLPTYFGDNISWFSAQEYQISSSNLTNQDIQLVPFVSAIPDWHTGTDTICGKIILSNPAIRIAGASSPAPIKNATVYLKDKDGTKVTYTTSKPDGSYAFKGVKAEDYTVSVEYGGTTDSGNDVAVTSDGNSSTVEAVQLSLQREDIATGVLDTYSHQKAFIAPNPANSVIKISLNESIPVKGEVKIIDGMGVIQYSSQVTIEAASDLELPISNLTNGIYLIEIISEGTIFNSKFIKY
jgi:hypothetical protein